MLGRARRLSRFPRRSFCSANNAGKAEILGPNEWPRFPLPFSCAHPLLSDRAVHFGGGCSEENVGKLTASLGDRIVVVTPAATTTAGGMGHEHAWKQAQRLMYLLRKEGLHCVEFSVIGAVPTAAVIDRGVDVARRFGARAVLSVGDEAVVGVGKAISVMLGKNEASDSDSDDSGGTSRASSAKVMLGSVKALLQIPEALGPDQERPPSALPARLAPLPHVAVPLTACAAGSSVTPYALVVNEADADVMCVLSGPQLVPHAAIVDPSLLTQTSASVQYAALAEGGATALAQALENVVTGSDTDEAHAHAHALSARILDSLCRSLHLAVEAVPPVGTPAAGETTGAPMATADVTLASLYAGLLIATTGMQTSQALALSTAGILPQQEAILRALLLPAVLEQYEQQYEQQSGNTRAFADKHAALIEQLAAVCSGPHSDSTLSGATAALLRPLHPYMRAQLEQHELSLDLDGDDETINGESADEMAERAQWFYDQFSAADGSRERLDEDAREEAVNSTLEVHSK